MIKSKLIEEMIPFVNYHDGGYLEPYVAEKLLDFLVEKGMLPPFDSRMCYMDGDNANQESIIYCKWERENKQE